MAIVGLKKRRPSASLAGSGGHDYEPTQPHGPRVKGKHPPSHSHTAFPKTTRKIGGGKQTHRKAF
jgi:hypothetical protein